MPVFIAYKSSDTETPKVYFAVLFCFLCLLPLLILRDFTPSNELRYLSIADEALRSNHWFVMTNHGLPYSDKPPFYFWIIMISKMLLGRHVFGVLSFFSILPALAIVCLMDYWCKPYLDIKSRITAVCMLLTTGYFAGSAVVLRMDMLMVLFIVGAMYCFYNLYMDVGCTRKYQWLFSVNVLLGTYSKGFMGFLVPLISVVVFLASVKQLHTLVHYFGWRLFVVLSLGIGVWFAMVLHEGGCDYLYTLVITQSVNRSVMHAPHGHPFLYYFYYLTYTVAPWTLFYVLTFCKAFKFRKIPLVRLFLIVISSTFLMLSCFKSKLEIYLLPIIPFMCYLSLLVFQKMRKNDRFWSFVFLVPAGLLVFAFPCYFYMLHIGFLLFAGIPLLLSSLSLTLFTLCAIWQFVCCKHLFRGVCCICVGVLLAIFIASFSLPQINPYTGYSQLAENAIKLQAQWGTKGYCTFRVCRSENIDALGCSNIREVKITDINRPENKGKLLIIPATFYHDKSLQVHLQGCVNRCREINYWYVKLQ